MLMIDTARGLYHFLFDRVPAGLSSVPPRPRRENSLCKDGKAAVSKVRVEQDLASSVARSVEFLGGLGKVISPGASATLTITATVDAGTGAQTITNTAELTAVDQGDPDSTPNNNQPSEDDQESVSLTVQAADLSVTKTVSNPTPNEGETINYTITLANDGPNTATNITITDVIPAGVTYSSHSATHGTYDSSSGLWSISSFANGASATLTITVTVDSGSGTQTITNTAELTAVDQADPDSTPNNNQPSEDDQESVSLNVLSADLAVSKTVNDSTPNEGDIISYTITLINNGPDTATNIIITDVLPSGATYSTHSASQGTYSDATGAWSVGSIANGASATLSISAAVDASTAGQTIINTAELTAVDQADPNSTPNNHQPAEDDQDSATSTVQAADLAVSKTVNNPTPNEGDSVTYTITLINNGPDTATSIIITDLLPAGVTYSSDTPSQGSYGSGSGAWSVGSLANGASATLTITATVDMGTAGQTVTNTASVTGVDQADPTPANNSASAAITIGKADLTVTKTVNDATPDESDTITYTITLINNGPTSATNIIVTDLLPSGVTYSSYSATYGSYNSINGQWSIPSCANGDSETLSINATVNTDTAGQTITNTVTIITADQEDPVPGNNSDSVGITVNIYPPQVTTNPATSIAATSARLNGNLDSMGTAPSVNISFDWTTDAYYIASGGSYEHNTGAWPVLSTGPFSFNLPGLSGLTTYHFRARAIAVGHGNANGTDMTFTTLPTPPNKPPTVNPIQGNNCVILPVTLESALFSDPDAGDTHSASQWQVRLSAGNYAPPVYNFVSTSPDLISIELTKDDLDHETNYHWHVRHQDSYGVWSNWSDEAYFRTADTPVGLDVTVYPDGADVNYTQVIEDGCTFLNTSDVTPTGHSEPATPRLGLFTEIWTTADHDGTITVGLPYPQDPFVHMRGKPAGYSEL
ncbi:DUF11 domain-containing protein, partial [Chloroflexota bacterium]